MGGWTGNITDTCPAPRIRYTYSKTLGLLGSLLLLVVLEVEELAGLQSGNITILIKSQQRRGIKRGGEERSD